MFKAITVNLKSLSFYDSVFFPVRHASDYKLLLIEQNELQNERAKSNIYTFLYKTSCDFFFHNSRIETIFKDEEAEDAVIV
jgi:hypothetical protein